MSDIQIWYKDNDMLIEVAGVTDKITGITIDNATITATLNDSSGSPVGGIVWPQSIDFVSAGLYRKQIDKAAVIVDGGGYTLIVDLSTPGGTDAHWEIPVGGDVRTS